MRQFVNSVSFAVVALSVVLSSQAQASQKLIPFSLGDLRVYIRGSAKVSPNDRVGFLGPTRLEIIEKNRLIEMKINNPKKFDQALAARQENSVLYQSWMDEVNEALAHKKIPGKINLKNEGYYRQFFLGTPIDLAKRIAKKQLYVAIHDNWSWIKTTVFNEYGSDTWNRQPIVHSPESPVQMANPSGSDLALEKINELLLFSPKLSDKNSYVFNFQYVEPTFVKVDRNIKTGQVGLDISSAHDVNTLEKGADKITAEESPDSGSSSGASNPGDESNNALPPPDNGNQFVPPTTTDSSF